MKLKNGLKGRKNEMLKSNLFSVIFNGGNIFSDVYITPNCDSYKPLQYEWSICMIDYEQLAPIKCDNLKECKKIRYNKNN